MFEYVTTNLEIEAETLRSRTFSFKGIMPCTDFCKPYRNEPLGSKYKIIAELFLPCMIYVSQKLVYKLICENYKPFLKTILVSMLYVRKNIKFKNVILPTWKMTQAKERLLKYSFKY